LDHLLPRKFYPNIADDRENWILACSASNNIKSDYDPNDNFIYAGNGPLSTDQRLQLLKNAKEYVKAEKARLERDFDQERAMFSPFIEESLPEQAAGG
jgi:hypothetical protein